MYLAAVNIFRMTFQCSRPVFRRERRTLSLEATERNAAYRRRSRVARRFTSETQTARGVDVEYVLATEGRTRSGRVVKHFSPSSWSARSHDSSRQPVSPLTWHKSSMPLEMMTFYFSLTFDSVEVTAFTPIEA